MSVVTNGYVTNVYQKTGFGKGAAIIVVRCLQILGYFQKKTTGGVMTQKGIFFSKLPFRHHATTTPPQEMDSVKKAKAILSGATLMGH